jgi:hypothetical protein
MTRPRLILILTLFAALACTGPAAFGQYAISVQQISAAINKTGLQIAPDQVTLLTDVVATKQDPALAVRSLQRSGASSAMVRLECENRKECLAFFVSVRVRPGNEAQLPAASSSATLGGSAVQSRSAPIVVRTGTPAKLELDGDRVHICIPVICLENGRAGQRIHATDKEHRQIYTAAVVESGLLRGSL